MYVRWNGDNNFPHWECLCIRCGGKTGDREYACEGSNKILNRKERDSYAVEDQYNLLGKTYIL